MTLVKAESPVKVIEVALDAYIEDVGWSGDLATKARAMLLESAIQPSVEEMRSKLRFADPCLNILQLRLDGLRLVDEADGGTLGPTTLAALERDDLTLIRSCAARP